MAAKALSIFEPNRRLFLVGVPSLALMPKPVRAETPEDAVYRALREVEQSLRLLVPDFREMTVKLDPEARFMLFASASRHGGQ